MADRVDVLRRISNILMKPGIDGLLASPDIMEEIFLVNHWVTQQGGPDFLDGKVLIGSINRGGLAGTVFELDDFVTAYTAEAIVDMNLDGGKMLFRLNPDSVIRAVPWRTVLTHCGSWQLTNYPRLSGTAG